MCVLVAVQLLVPAYTPHKAPRPYAWGHDVPRTCMSTPLSRPQLQNPDAERHCWSNRMLLYCNARLLHAAATALPQQVVDAAQLTRSP